MASMIFKGGRVFDGFVTYENASVVIDTEKGIISGFGERGSFEEPKDSKIISLEGLTAMPGLIDSHVHFFGTGKTSGLLEWALVPESLAVLRSVHDARLLLRAGFTTVRELGTKGGTFLAQAADEKVFPSPRIVSCARALAQTGCDDDPTILPVEMAQKLASYSYFCDGPWESRKAVRMAIREGAKVIKLYASGGFSQGGHIRTNFTQEEIRAIVEEAHKTGLKVAAHAYGEEALINSIEAGADSIEHGLGLTSKIAKQMSAKGTYYVPTLVAYLKTKPKENVDVRNAIQKQLTEEVTIARENNVKVVMGSDIVGDSERPHGRNYEEIKEESKFLGNQGALVSATSEAADCLGFPQ